MLLPQLFYQTKFSNSQYRKNKLLTPEIKQFSDSSRSSFFGSIPVILKSDSEKCDFMVGNGIATLFLRGGINVDLNDIRHALLGFSDQFNPLNYYIYVHAWKFSTYFLHTCCLFILELIGTIGAQTLHDLLFVTVRALYMQQLLADYKYHPVEMR
jgi:hypothetical protein